MDNRISIEKIIKEIKTSDFVLNCKMPMGYSAGLPVLQIKNGSLCLMIPYLKYKVTGEVDKTLVFPIRYTVSLELPEQNIIGFADLSFDKNFEKLDFAKPIGLFRHNSIKAFSKAEYQSKRSELFALYNKLANALVYGEEFTDADDIKMRELLRLLVEPSLNPIYKALDKDFYNKYLA